MCVDVLIIIRINCFYYRQYLRQKKVNLKNIKFYKRVKKHLKFKNIKFRKNYLKDNKFSRASFLNNKKSRYIMLHKI